MSPWQTLNQLLAHKFICGFCNNKVSSKEGYFESLGARRTIYICPECENPTLFYEDKQVPGIFFGEDVNNLPNDIYALYQEGRASFSVSSFTATILCCRKILMHVAVEKGAKKEEKFLYYVNFLDTEGYLPKNSKNWVDYIRLLGNEANHEIKLMKKEDAEKLIKFVSMLLKIIYEFPGEAPKEKSKK
jgi:hypothetical protein